MKRVEIKLSDEQFELLNLIAELNKISYIELLENIVQEHLIKNKAEVNQKVINFWTGGSDE